MQLLEGQVESEIYKFVFSNVQNIGFSTFYTYFVTSAILTAILIGFLIGLDFFLRKFILLLVVKFISKTKTKIDDIFIENKVLHYLTHIVPLYVAKEMVPIIFKGFPNWINIATKATDILLVLTITLLLQAIFRSLRDFIKTKSAFVDKPIDSYLQVANIIVASIAVILVFSAITGQSPWKFLLSLGAASAILMLVFRDTILGFVASIQVSSNDMVRVGDWIEMPKYGADGTVMQINLSTVKVQNFDKTITTIPTYALISDSFKNYRGMQNAGGRRIKRSLFIKMSSIRFLTDEEIQELRKIQLLKSYIDQRTTEIDAYNQDKMIDDSLPINGRRLTNIGMFREYIRLYTHKNPFLHPDYPFMVRHMQPTEHGLPLELYMFTNTTVWLEYEGIMSDIFDHLFAAIKYFNLEIFELPASDDVRIAFENFPVKDSSSK